MNSIGTLEMKKMSLAFRASVGNVFLMCRYSFVCGKVEM